ncbi:MAG TPA: hypothetical protein PLL62_03580 [Candidatus Saccharicenans sp.]|jgi:hypothetical protein|nr:hypothetical protein [Candidatus Saccharicenans sp.]HQM74305.1 hypothetical protein [Candidatus Saccharicenans sp.]
MSGRSWRVIVILFASSLLFVTSPISGDGNVQPSSLAMECPEDSAWQGNMSEIANLTNKNGVIQDGQAKQSANDQSQFNIKFSLECFNVKRILRLASGHFTICYVMNIDREGRPRFVQALFPTENIKKTLRVELGSDEVLSCIQNNWRFVGFDPDSAITVLLSWQHQKGYETMMIYSDKFSYMMRLIPTVYEDK